MHFPLFRMYSTTNKKVAVGGLVKNRIGMFISDESLPYQVGVKKLDEVQALTPFKDKNGTPIWEGDKFGNNYLKIDSGYFKMMPEGRFIKPEEFKDLEVTGNCDPNINREYMRNAQKALHKPIRTTKPKWDYKDI